MEPNHLKINELDYELRLRNIEPTGDVESKRKTLRGLLSQERANRSFGTKLNPFLFAEDKQFILETINDLRTKIDEFTGTQDNLQKRISSRLTHLANRIHRLNLVDDEHHQIKSELNLQLISLEADLADKLNIAHSTPRKPGGLETLLGDLHLSNILATSHIKPVLPCKWNLSFSGIHPNESVISFLEKVECFRISRAVSKEELLTCAGDLFKAKAWTWFTVNKDKFQTWDDLVSKLKQDFLPYNYEEDLLDEINRRTQGRDEKVSQYICDMEALFNRLPTKPDESHMIHKIRRNLLPQYISHLALQDISSLDELTLLCKRLEESLSWSDRYKPPLTRKSQLLEPDLSYSTAHAFRSNTNNVSTINLNKCWNCNQSGHHYNVCKFRRNIFCFGCGAKNVTKNNCECCSKNWRQGGINLEAPVSSTSIPGPFQFKKAHNISQIKNRHLKTPADGNAGSSK